MEKVKKDLIALLKMHLDQTRGSVHAEEKEWEQICDYAGKNAVGGMLYNAIGFLEEKNKPGLAVQRLLRQQMLLTVTVSVSQETAMEEVKEKLNACGIWHVLFKGYLLKQLYPVPELRTMGDIDFLIREEQRQACHEAILELGFSCTTQKGCVWCYSRGNVFLEVHTNLMAGEPWNGVDYETYYKGIFAHVETIDRFTCRLKPEYHFVFLVNHAAKHLRHAGFGIRGGVLDFVVFLRACGDTLDWREVWEQLETLRLTRYAQVILELCRRWFDVEVDTKTGCVLSEEEWQLFVRVMFEGGVYGYIGRNREQVQIRNQMDEKDREKVKAARFRVALRSVFPGVRYMRMYLPAVERHVWLLPAAWIVRWFEAVFFRGRRNLKRIRLFMETPGQEMTEEYQLLKKLGLL